MDGLIIWFQNWFLTQCNGSWEHDFGVLIESLDNPGWSFEIDTNDTANLLKDQEWTLNEINEDDWFGYKVENGKFIASGDPSKFLVLLELFKKLIENCSTGKI